MIEYREKSEVMTICCDNCLIEGVAHGSFKECMDAFKDKGWKTYKDDGTWRHSCSKCFAEWKRDNPMKK